MNSLLILALLLLTCSVYTQTAQCRTCNRCISCSPDVYTDAYIDGIDGILQSKIEKLGYLVMIIRRVESNHIMYTFTYSGGLLIKLALQLPSLQIQLLSYEITGQQSSQESGQATGSSQTTTTTTQTASTSQTTSSSGTSSSSHSSSASQSRSSFQSGSSSQSGSTQSGSFSQSGSSSSQIYQTTSDGYFIITNLQSDTQV